MKSNHKQSKLLISVIVPVYNVENYIDKCIASILAQTYEYIELILVNDGSTDLSGQICDNYAKNDSRVIVIHQENQGQSVARNKGLFAANGKIISFIDSDDWIELNMFESMISLMIENRLKVIECDIISSIDLNQGDKFSPLIEIENSNEFMQRVISNEYFSVCRRIYDKDLLKGLSFIPNKLYEDLFFTMEVLTRVNSLGYLQFPFYVYYKERLDSTMRSNYNQKKLDSIDAGAFLVKKTMNYDARVKRSSVNYLLKFLSQHYEQLFANPELDMNLAYRKQIRRTIEKHYNRGDFVPYAFMVKIMPIWLYKWFFKINRARINFKLKFTRP